MSRSTGERRRPIRGAPGYRAIDIAKADRVKAMEDGAEWCARHLEDLAIALPEQGQEAHGRALLELASLLRGLDMAWAADALHVERAQLPTGYAVRPSGPERVTYVDGRTVEPRWQAHGPDWKGDPRGSRWMAVYDALVHAQESRR